MSLKREYTRSITGTKDGIKRVNKHANRLWKERAREAVRAVAEKFRHYTVNNVWLEMIERYGKRYVLSGTHKLCAMGAVMCWAEREKIHIRSSAAINRPCISGIGHVTTRPIWVSRVYIEQPEKAVA